MIDLYYFIFFLTFCEFFMYCNKDEIFPVELQQCLINVKMEISELILYLNVGEELSFASVSYHSTNKF